MMLRRYISCALAALCLLACRGEDYLAPTTPLVVDGWIDAGGHPVVMVSKTMSPTDVIQDASAVASKMVGYAKVFVSDGATRVELEGRRDDNYFPPYIYTTDAITGVPGKRYRLEVYIHGISAWAETTVPAPVPLDSQVATVSSRYDSLYTLHAYLKDNPATHDYYKVFTMVEGANTSWNSSFMGIVDDETVQGQYLKIPVARGMDILEKYRQPLFREGETVHVKFCAVDAVSYEYWRTYDDISAFARNPFFPVTENAASNMHGALGFWGGYGASFYRITIQND